MRCNGIRVLTIVPSLLFVIASFLAAQGPRIAPGDTVRVTVRPNVRYVGVALPLGATMGTFLGMAGDSVRFLRSDRPAMLNILPPAAVRRIEIPEGRHSNALRGLLTGSATGLVLGGLAFGACKSGYLCPEPPFGSAMAGIAATGVVFGILGAGVGSMSHRRTWTRISPWSLAPRDSLQAENP